MKRAVFALLGLAVVACGRRDSDGDLPVIDVVGSLGTYRYIPMSELIDEVEYIPLETAPNFLIGRTDYIIVTDDHIFIEGLNGTSSVCYAFTREGKFISDIGRTGRGPGEWSFVFAMSVDEKNRLIYLDTYERVFEYTWDGKFVRDFEKPKFQREQGVSIVSEAEFFGNGLFLGYMDNRWGDEPYSWVIFDSAGTVLKTFDNHIKLDREPFSASTLRSKIMSSGSIAVKEGINDTVFIFNRRNELVPSFVFNRGKYAFPSDARLTAAGMYELESKAVNVVNSPFWYMTMSDDHIYFSTKVGNRTGFQTPPGLSSKMFVFGQEVEVNDSGDVMGLYDIGSGKTELLDRDPATRLPGFVNDIDGGLSFWPKYYDESENILVDVWDAYKMKDLLTEDYFATHPARDPAAHTRLRALLENLDEGDNPVIVIAKLKK